PGVGGARPCAAPGRGRGPLRTGSGDARPGLRRRLAVVLAGARAATGGARFTPAGGLVPVGAARREIPPLNAQPAVLVVLSDPAVHGDGLPAAPPLRGHRPDSAICPRPPALPVP